MGQVTGGLQIPAGKTATHVFDFPPNNFLDFFTDEIQPGTPFYVHSASHHMHTLGTHGIQAIRHADGTDECLVDIQKWDFNWQGSFAFNEPRLVQPGDNLYIECRYDNEAGENSVFWGDGTNDEMCLGVMYISAAD